MTGTERIRLESHIRDLASELNSNYPGMISDEKVEDLVTKYMSLECSYDEAIKIVDASLASLMDVRVDPQEAEKTFINNMLENYNKQHNVSNPDKFFGDSINVLMVELFKLYDEADALDYSLEGKMLYFIRGRDELINKYKDINITICSMLEKISFDDMKKLRSNFMRNVDLVNDDLDSRMDMVVKSSSPLFIDGEFNKNAISLEHLERVFDFAIEHGKQIKLSNLLNANIFPSSLERELANKSPEECRRIVLLFWEEYIKYLANWAKEKGYRFRQIDVISDIANDRQNDVLYLNCPWNKYVGKNPSNGDLYFIDFIKIVRKYFSDTELVYCEDFEFLPEKSSKVVTIMDYIKKVEQRDGVRLIDAIGLDSRYFDWSSKRGRAVNANDIYDSMLDLFGIGLPLYRTDYSFKTNMKVNSTKDDLLHAIRITDQYCDISGVILSSNKDNLLLDDYSPNDEYNYYLDGYSVSKDNVIEEDEDPDKELTQTMILKLMADEDAPSGYILSNSLLVFIILVFSLLVIVASILLN
ncbi:MAG: endo-1,4-beta-xylanase [Bacilli bacterium]|nr:endo-1,4-beta-xylanase [Bacilli bacterium]